jgi:hypothetical protein
MTLNRIALAAFLLVLQAISLSCGYHAGGTGDMVPKDVQTIAVLPFRNLTTRYRLADAFQQAISREMVSRTRFQVVRDKEKADAVMTGTIRQVVSGPLVFDPATGRTSLVSLNVYMDLNLVDRATGKTIYSRSFFEVHSAYQIAANANQYFDESTLALERVSADVARSVVSGIMENF